MKKQAIIYTRVSTNEQVLQGISLAAQLEQSRQYAAFRGLEVVEDVCDEGVSGSVPLGERPGGQRLLELVQDPNVSAVVSYKLDRVFRDAADCLAVTKAWDEVDVELHLVDIGGQPIDTSTAMGRFFLTVMAGVAEMERNLIIERTRAAIGHLKASGRRVGSIPYGFVLGQDGTTLQEDPEEQRVIHLVRRLRRKGVSLRQIARELDRKGYRSRSGKLFYPTQIRRMLL